MQKVELIFIAFVGKQIQMPRYENLIEIKFYLVNSSVFTTFDSVVYVLMGVERSEWITGLLPTIELSLLAD